VIQQDVVRTNPNVDYYRQENVQEIMINILFCYARQYPAICYRQGMHEILAPLIFVLHCDHQSLCHIQEETNICLDPILVDVLDPLYIEEDSYYLFCQIMNSLELFYRINDMTITESGQLTNLPPRDPDSQSPPKKSSEIEVVHQLNMVRDKIFAKQDLHLHNHLLKLEIPLALFGIRWLRLLFGREFNLLDLLILWDAIFGVGNNLEFTYYIVVAMLIHIRDRLLSNDYTTCLTLLMRYPTNADVSLIIRHALYMCTPDKYQCPPNAFVYVINSMKQRISYPTRVYPPLATIGVRNPHLTPSPRKMSEELRRETAKMTQNTRKSQNDDLGIVEGYALNDPEVIKIELQDTYNLMAVCRLKLVQYSTILRKYIPGNQVDELHQTLDGIEELCSLLKPKNQYLFSSTALPVDAAFEADDDEVLNDTASSSSSSTLLNRQRSFPMAKNINSASYEVPNVKVSRTTSQLLEKNKKEVEMDLIRASVIGCVDLSQYPQENPTAIDSSSSE
jgi:TBC1 domain family protein 5